MSELHWHCVTWDELRRDDLYELLQLRQQVFVVEQNCPYQDADGLDRLAWHLLGREASGQLVAYARLLPSGTRFRDPSAGRVVVSPSRRGQGLGQLLMQRCLSELEKRLGPVAVRVSAQRYLEKFYRDLGFAPVGEPYDEDGIPHVEMLRP